MVNENGAQTLNVERYRLTLCNYLNEWLGHSMTDGQLVKHVRVVVCQVSYDKITVK